MERSDIRNDDIVDIGDATALTRGVSPIGQDDVDGTLRQFAAISDED
ncbi:MULTISPECIES: benenodin family lasso peptide [Sphingomonas]|uniref:Benenodin family lasso peptide n=1 Tax=Sphingomonas glacialis TaxID=658225 RepID=A0A502FRH4_9SPHN|nr:benenodin family lasso peptide [Sphingomonas glacialis]TPG51756.1 benenodin family lasso peptide [Sphingomonas glacialis]